MWYYCFQETVYIIMFKSEKAGTFVYVIQSKVDGCFIQSDLFLTNEALVSINHFRTSKVTALFASCESGHMSRSLPLSSN